MKVIKQIGWMVVSGAASALGAIIIHKSVDTLTNPNTHAKIKNTFAGMKKKLVKK